MFEETSQLGLKNKYKFVPKGNKKSQIVKHSSKIPAFRCLFNDI